MGSSSSACSRCVEIHSKHHCSTMIQQHLCLFHQRHSHSLVRSSTAVFLAAHCCLVVVSNWYYSEGADVYGSQPNPMGFHEGARRIVQCDGGHVVGFEVYVSHIGGYPEPTLNALRIVCSSSRILVEHETGSLPDTIIFGNMPERGQPFPGGCEQLVHPPHTQSNSTQQQQQ